MATDGSTLFMDVFQILTVLFLVYGAYLAVCRTGVSPDLRDPLRGRAVFEKARALAIDRRRRERRSCVRRRVDRAATRGHALAGAYPAWRS